ncbi:MAG: bifunctional diguanylate cyclase/phosphodiesterase, partial [Gammaproteobacteria bacterium]
SYLTSKINQFITARATSSLVIIIIGIDRFREINDTLGHDFGDLLLKEFGTRLKNEFWSNDTIARFGSDQYALLLPLSDQSHLDTVIQKIDKILKTPFMIQDIHIVTNVSIGISIYPEHGQTAATLLKCAEVAMYNAKKSGAFHKCYEPDKDPNSVERLQLMTELNYAIERNELTLHYQPKIDIERGDIISCEALLRWTNNNGMIPPDIFIPLAEQGSIIKNLTEWVLEEAVKQCANWHKSGHKISIAVNLSARLLIESDILKLVRNTLYRHQLPAEFLILEITESAIMIDPARAHEMMKTFQQMGVRLSIDDFGTGYTSISHMRDLPVSEIKIDKSFVLNMLNNPSDAVLVKLIIDMAHGMKHLVVAEGIEDQATLDALNRMGCDIAQGYFLGRPMPLHLFNDFLKDQTISTMSC